MTDLSRATSAPPSSPVPLDCNDTTPFFSTRTCCSVPLAPPFLWPVLARPTYHTGEDEGKDGVVDAERQAAVGTRTLATHALLDHGQRGERGSELRGGRGASRQLDASLRARPEGGESGPPGGETHSAVSTHTRLCSFAGAGEGEGCARASSPKNRPTHRPTDPHSALVGTANERDPAQCSTRCSAAPRQAVSEPEPLPPPL